MTKVEDLSTEEVRGLFKIVDIAKEQNGWSWDKNNTSLNQKDRR